MAETECFQKVVKPAQFRNRLPRGAFHIGVSVRWVREYPRDILRTRILDDTKITPKDPRERLV